MNQYIIQKCVPLPRAYEKQTRYEYFTNVYTSEKIQIFLLLSSFSNRASLSDATVQDDINITVQILLKLVLVNLNLKVSLSKIRDKLEKNSEVKMNDTFSFAKMINNNSSTGESLLAVIAREDEEMIILENIIDVKNDDKFLYLKSDPEPKPDWRFFKDKLKLEYGRSVTLEKANSRAFTIVDCEMDEIIDGYENSTIQIDSEEDKIIKNDFLLIADIDIPNFAKLGVSIKNSNIKNSNVTTNLTYNIIEYNKMSLKFKLEPTTEFIEAVKGVIASKDPRKFKDIINDFGRFIPKKVILASNIKIEKKSSKSLSKSNSFKYQSFKLFGGKEVCSNNFNESDWVESLNGFKNWSCIKFEDPVNIFQLLSEDLRKQILLLVGKKILYTNTEDYTYYLFVPGMYHTFKLNIPENILEILQHKDAECSIFSTVIDEKGKDTFNCQVIWPPNEDPKLIIHCIQKNFRKRECKLKIIWMIVGYDINFDFNHSDFNVKLKFNSLESKPKLFSLYSAPNNYGPFFLKQKASEIKVKYIDVYCNQDNCICKRLMKSENKDLCKQVLLLVGKKILYTNTEDYTYHLSVPGIHHTFKLNIPKNILEILQNKDAECSIFATVIDKKEKNVFNCQVVWPSNEDPKLIIHCFQKKFKKCECKLKIMWMIVGYDTSFDFNHSDFNIKLKVLKIDFNALNCQAIVESLDLEYNPSVLCFGIPVLSESDSLNNSQIIGHYFLNDKGNRKIGSYLFSYCLENNHFVNLPNFTFHTLLISNYPNPDNYGILPFQHMSKIRKILKLIKLNSFKLTPKFISLYSTENIYVPIFLKQKTCEIKIKYINVNCCNQDNCIWQVASSEVSVLHDTKHKKKVANYEIVTLGHSPLNSFPQ
ncbi:hypothetical protein RhiirA4_465955 [Rhizophagus irregularis]|uniref:MACPF domain-containing protein n=1 Tax=Rhizophagus irregularis TaxID=588596 RepID=A0A2I1GTF5_9GLOM|nr:hypothetical protein RhiirA4_465955 [Rhizophagus irregularis]